MCLLIAAYMSHFLFNEPCPQCRSNGSDKNGDNLAVYSDGHKYCFKCKYFVTGDKLHALRNVSAIKNPKDSSGIKVTEFSEDALRWLKKYNLTNDEIFTFFKGTSNGWAFTTEKFTIERNLYRQPKVKNFGEILGNEPIIHVNSTLVIVEDVVSMVKVGRQFSCCALLKSSLNDILLLRLAKDYDHLVLWLDPDMSQHMVKRLLPKCRLLFKSVKVVFSENDPKDHTDSEIYSYVTGG